MRSVSNLAAFAALLAVASAGDAPVVNGNPLDVTFSATIPQKDATSLSGAIKIAGAPNGEGVNIQLSLYNLPNGEDLSYGLYTGNVASGGDCSNTGSLLNPYNGITGTQCKKDNAACAIGDLSDAYGMITATEGGSGTGYFAVNYVDKYLSVKPGDPAYVGKGSFVVKDSTGANLICANFVNAQNPGPSSKKAAKNATKTTAAPSSSAGSGSGSGSGSSNQSGNSGAFITAAPIIGVGMMGVAALVL